jgi:hypothetical protein
MDSPRARETRRARFLARLEQSIRSERNERKRAELMRIKMALEHAIRSLEQTRPFSDLPERLALEQTIDELDRAESAGTSDIGRLVMNVNRRVTDLHLVDIDQGPRGPRERTNDRMPLTPRRALAAHNERVRALGVEVLPEFDNQVVEARNRALDAAHNNQGRLSRKRRKRKRKTRRH